MMRVVGLDLSLVATGISDANGCRTVGYSVKKTAPWTERAKRLKFLGTEVDRATRGADLVVIESPAYGSETGAFLGGTLHGIVMVLMLQRQRHIAYVTPQQLKKFATGHGNAGKPAVLAAAIRDGSPAKDFDEADAWWLRQMGLFAYSPDRRALTSYKQQVLDAVAWPLIERRESA